MHAEELLPVNGLVRKTKLDQIQLHCIIKQAKPNDNSSLIKSCSEEGQLSTPLLQSAPPTGSSTRRVAGHTDLVSAATAEGADALYLVSLESEFWVRVRKGEAVGLPFLGVVGPIGRLHSTAGTDMYFAAQGPGQLQGWIFLTTGVHHEASYETLLAMSSLTNPQCWNF
jgi:hypothetical protein